MLSDYLRKDAIKSRELYFDRVFFCNGKPALYLDPVFGMINIKKLKTDD